MLKNCYYYYYYCYYYFCYVPRTRPWLASFSRRVPCWPCWAWVCPSGRTAQSISSGSSSRPSAGPWTEGSEACTRQILTIGKYTTINTTTKCATIFSTKTLGFQMVSNPEKINFRLYSVSYTHLTLPTIYSV